MRTPNTVFRLCMLGLLCLPGLAGIGQSIDDCKLVYGELKEVVNMSADDMQVGTYVYLSASYLRDLAQGKFKQVPSGLIYYDYVRPASKEELKTNTIEGSTREVIGRDHNVYVRSVPQAAFHFFQPNAAFEGTYKPHWEDPDQVIPLGLEPLDITPFADIPFYIRQRHDEYLLLESGSSLIVFYVGFPKLEDIFETGELYEKVQAKQRRAESLLGQPFYLREAATAPFRSGNQATAPSDLFGVQKLKSIVLSSAKAYDDQVCWELASIMEDSLILSDTSSFELFTPGCIQDLQEAYRDGLLEDAAIENEIIDQALRKDKEWRENPELAHILSRRFWIDGNGYYHYLLTPQEPREAFLGAQLHADGSIWLKSHFASPEGLYHTRAIVYIGNRRDSLVTERVSTTDTRHHRYYDGDWVVEEINFTKKNDLSIIKRLALQAHRPIRVRYKAGGMYYADSQLSEVYKQQIRDAWMLGELLSTQGISQAP